MSKKIEFEAKLDTVPSGEFVLSGFKPRVMGWALHRRDQRYRVTLEPLPPALLPCPFCGHDNVGSNSLHDYGSSEYWMECINCHARGEKQSNRQDAIERWNRRAS